MLYILLFSWEFFIYYSRLAQSTSSCQKNNYFMFDFYHISIEQGLIIGIFLWINSKILLWDIRTRKIENRYLIGLIALLPFWIYVFSISYETIVLHLFLSLILLWIWILLYSDTEFIGAWDLKYAAILFMFLWDTPLKLLITNVGIITIMTLLFWCSMICGMIWAMRKYIPKDDPTLPKKWKNIIIKDWLKKWGILIVDWLIIGYILMEAIHYFMYQLRISIWANNDIYFLLSILIFLSRGYLRRYIFEGKYKSYGILWIIWFFLYRIQENGYPQVIQSLIYYGENILPYAIVLMLTYLVTTRIFYIYDNLIRDIWREATHTQTIPYAVIIFMGFCITFFWNIDLISTIRSV